MIFLDLMFSCSSLQLISFALNFRDLGNSNISGTLGSELGELKHLQYLYCSYLSAFTQVVLYFPFVLCLVIEKKNKNKNKKERKEIQIF